MDGPHLFGHVSVADRPSCVQELATALMAGRSALVTGPLGTEDLLAALAQSFAATRTRMLRVRPPLGLPDFMEQVAPSNVAAGDPGLVQGYLALTMPDHACDRIVLLVESAHLLPHATLRYLELALRAGPHLRVVFGGRSEIVDVLALDEFAGLRQRLSFHLVLPEQAPVPHVPAPIATPASPPPGRSLRWPWMVAGAAVAGSVLLAAWLTQPVPPSSAGPELAGAEAVLAAESASPEAQPPVVAAADLDPAPDPAPSPAAAAQQANAAAASVPQPDRTGAAVEPPPTMPQAIVAPPGANASPEAASVAAATEPPAEPAPPMVNVPEPRRETPPAVLVVTPAPGPLLRRRLQPIPPPSRPERVAARPSPSREDERRCLGIIQRVQLGDTPTDGDRTFLRNGCH